jgi:hypothetical protein
MHITCEACGHQTGVRVNEKNVRTLMREVARWRWAQASQEERSRVARVAAKARWRKERREKRQWPKDQIDPAEFEDIEAED